MMHNEGNHEAPHEPLTKSQQRQYMFIATLTALGMALIISAGMVLFVLFCVYVWF